MNPDDHQPGKQFERVVEELRKFSLVMDEAQRAVETARGIDGVEARRALAVASTRLEEARYWFGVGLRSAHKTGRI